MLDRQLAAGPLIGASAARRLHFFSPIGTVHHESGNQRESALSSLRTPPSSILKLRANKDVIFRMTTLMEIGTRVVGVGGGKLGSKPDPNYIC